MEEQKEQNNTPGNIPKCSSHTIIIIAVAIIVALLSGGGIYYWQNTNFNNLSGTTEQQISDLQNHVTGLEEQYQQTENKKNELETSLNKAEEDKIILEDKIVELANELEVLKTPPSRNLILTDSLGGEKLCFDDTHTIKWQNKGYEGSVVLFVTQVGRTGGIYSIGSVPASSQEFDWTVGQTNRLIGSSMWNLKNDMGELREMGGWQIILRHESVQEYPDTMDASHSGVEKSLAFSVAYCDVEED
ncbi:hypothetical protein ACFLY5_00825 [Patescibacteria group bacterium]